MEVIKRDGTKVPFKGIKIIEAIIKAKERVGFSSPYLGSTVAKKVDNQLLGVSEVSVVEVENLVEKELKELAPAVYKEYSAYRQNRKEARFLGSDTAKVVEDIIFGGRNERENGNLDENTFSAKNTKIANVTGEALTRAKLLSPDVNEAFKKGKIHIHDMSAYILGSHNCTTIDLEDLLSKGFKTKNGGVRPPKSITAALDLTYLLIGTISQNQFGGCAIAGFDTCMAPYVKMSYKKHYKLAFGILDDNEKAIELALTYTHNELYQGMEGFFHNLSTAHTREGNQLSFSSINYGNDTDYYAVTVSKCILETRAKGIGINREIPIFPIGIFQYSHCLHGEGKPLEWLFNMAVESTAKNIYPNYCYVSDEDSRKKWKAKKSTMGCRTMNNYDRFATEEDRTGRGNISPVTINLPYLALEAKGNGVIFVEKLEEALILTEKALLERFEYQASQKGKNAPFLYENGVLKSDKPIGAEDTVREAIKHGSLVFGYIGLAEALTCLTGEHHGESKKSLDIATQIIQMIRAYADEASERNNLNFGCYATPAESLCMKARDKTVKEFGIVEGVTDKEYFTNSHHIPVGFPITAIEKIRIEAPFSKLATAGTILYTELTGDSIYNPEAVKTLIREAMFNEAQYYAVNVPRDTCNECGYKHYDLVTCPKCGSNEIKQLRRITGYTTSEVKHMNDGKQAEVRDRVKHLSFNNLEALT